MAAGQPAPAYLPMTASQPVIDVLNQILAPFRQRKEVSGGTLVVRSLKMHAVNNDLMIDGCFDQRKLVTIRANGTRYYDSTVREMPTMLALSTLTPANGTWRITDYTLKKGTC